MIKLRKIPLREAKITDYITAHDFEEYKKNALDYFCKNQSIDYKRQFDRDFEIIWDNTQKKYVPNDNPHLFIDVLYFHAGYDKELEEAFPNRAWLSMFDKDGVLIKSAYGKIKELLNKPQYKKLAYTLLNLWVALYGKKPDGSSYNFIIQQFMVDYPTEIIIDDKEIVDWLTDVCRQIENSQEILDFFADYPKAECNLILELVDDPDWSSRTNLPNFIKVSLKIKNKKTSDEQIVWLKCDRATTGRLRTDGLIDYYINLKTKCPSNYRMSEKDMAHIKWVILGALKDYFQYHLPEFLQPNYDSKIELEDKIVKFVGKSFRPFAKELASGRVESDYCALCITSGGNIIALKEEPISNADKYAVPNIMVSVAGTKYSLNNDFDKLLKLLGNQKSALAAVTSHDYTETNRNRGTGIGSSGWYFVGKGPILDYYLKTAGIVWDKDKQTYICTTKSSPLRDVSFSYKPFAERWNTVFDYYFGISYDFWSLD